MLHFFAKKLGFGRLTHLAILHFPIVLQLYYRLRPSPVQGLGGLHTAKFASLNASNLHHNAILFIRRRFDSELFVSHATIPSLATAAA